MRPVRPDAMDEIFRQVRQIVIDDVRDVIHMQTAGGYVGGDQNLQSGPAEIQPAPRCVCDCDRSP